MVGPQRESPLRAEKIRIPQNPQPNILDETTVARILRLSLPSTLRYSYLVPQVRQLLRMWRWGEKVDREKEKPAPVCLVMRT